MIKPKYQVVEDRPELIRDTYSKGITNRDTSAYEKYMESASKRKQRREQIDNTTTVSYTHLTLPTTPYV